MEIDRKEETKLYAMLRKIYPYLSILLLCSGTVFIHYRGIWIDENYPSLIRVKSEFSGNVIKKSSALVYKGTYLVDLDNDIKFLIGTRTTNYEYRWPYLYDFLSVGDSIYHPKGRGKGSAFYVYRDGKTYFFKLGESINKR